LLVYESDGAWVKGSVATARQPLNCFQSRHSLAARDVREVQRSRKDSSLGSQDAEQFFGDRNNPPMSAKQLHVHQCEFNPCEKILRSHLEDLLRELSAQQSNFPVVCRWRSISYISLLW
jgi:hypothetical protein